MPSTDDGSLITCAADGEVRCAQISERGVETRMVTKHKRGAYGFAIEPGSPHMFYSCGADGLVKHIDLRNAASTKLFKVQNVSSNILKLEFLNHLDFGWCKRLKSLRTSTMSIALGCG
ncbi:hypothetical protein HRI_002391300 [Hibiscus trionum]|uniref:Uncharacterized protein n=1 Tax=Hibiscus trionum TaxID=183268 RepID=A0A9W7I460_HIBTR|nr:hypothetical protein HRI_002391300 [Hibiscus trionum]